MNWSNLYFGKVSAQAVQEAVKDPEWQKLRKSLKGKSLEEKYDKLTLYYRNQRLKWVNSQITDYEWVMVQVRLTNYVTALSRGGLIKPSDYRRN